MLSLSALYSVTQLQLHLLGDFFLMKIVLCVTFRLP